MGQAPAVRGGDLQELPLAAQLVQHVAPEHDQLGPQVAEVDQQRAHVPQGRQPAALAGQAGFEHGLLGAEVVEEAAGPRRQAAGPLDLGD